MGPFALDRHHYREVTKLPSESGGVFEIFGRTEYFGRALPTPAHTELRPVFIPTPTPPKRIKKRQASEEGASTARPSETPNFDQIAIQAAKELAERDPAGNVVHTVKSKAETLQSITQWYTASADATKDVASKNALPADAALKPGAKVIVPKELVTNPKRMK